MIREVRRLHETLTHRAVESLFQPVVELEGGRVLGYEALTEEDRDPRPSAARQAVLVTDCRLTARLRQLRRAVAIEEASGLAGDLCIFVSLHASEIGAARLVESLGRLRGGLAPEQRLVVGLPDSAVSGVPYAQQFRGQLRELGIGIACGGTAAGELDPVGPSEVRPDFLTLAPPLVGGIDRNAQRLRQAESIVRAARKLGCGVIAVGIKTEQEAEACRKLGCRYGQGDFLGCPRPIYSWLAGGLARHGGTASGAACTAGEPAG
jgi:EAL domain-containing protein (putative c-di-GMP-specific phosphodiesterase class I)